MNDSSIAQSLINFAMTIPVWSILIFLWSSKEKKRDDFQMSTTTLLHGLDKRTALIEKENELNRIIFEDVKELKQRFEKNTNDLNLCYERIRQIEDRP